MPPRRRRSGRRLAPSGWASWSLPRGRARRTVAIASGALLAVVAVVLGLVGWLALLYPLSAAGHVGRTATVELVATDGPDEVARKLADAGLVDSPWLFATYVRLVRAHERLRAGRHRLRPGLTVRQTLERIAIGYGRPTVRVTIPEGATRFEVARRMAEAGVGREDEWLEVTADDSLLALVGVREIARHRAEHRGVRASLEGYLFPDTYELRLDGPPRLAVERMVRTWKRRVEPLVASLSADGAAQQLDLHARVTLASIVEREARVAAERPVIAGVFLNRLFQSHSADNRVPRRLQADPTVAYGCLAAPDRSASCEGFVQRVTPSMTAARDNPYSTYAFDGLPPGPIASPGAAAIRAVLEPARHAYLYFVAIGGGRHRFSRTLEDHNRAVRESGPARGGVRKETP